MNCSLNRSNRTFWEPAPCTMDKKSGVSPNFSVETGRESPKRKAKREGYQVPLTLKGPWKCRQGLLPFMRSLSCLSKNSASSDESCKQLLQWRTGSTKHIRGSGILLLQHPAQKQSPQRRQWCYKQYKNTTTMSAYWYWAISFFAYFTRCKQHPRYSSSRICVASSKWSQALNVDTASIGLAVKSCCYSFTFFG